MFMMYAKMGTIDELRKLDGQEYLFYEDQLEIPHVAVVDNVPSQYFRRVVAAQGGRGNQDPWHWRAYLPMAKELHLKDKIRNVRTVIKEHMQSNQNG